MHSPQSSGRVFGVPDLPLVMIAHPLGGLSFEQVQGRALVAIPQVVELIKSVTTAIRLCVETAARLSA